MVSSHEFSEKAGLGPERELGISFVTLACVDIDDKTALLLHKSGQEDDPMIYTPIGGAVAVPKAQALELEDVVGGEITWRRDPDHRGWRDLRILTKSSNVDAVIDWVSDLDEEVRSPAREFEQELVDEARLVDPHELNKEGSVSFEHLGYDTQLWSAGNGRRKRLTFVVSEVWQAAISSEIADSLVAAAREEIPPILMVSKEDLEDLVDGGRAGANALALLNYGDHITAPDQVLKLDLPPSRRRRR